MPRLSRTILFSLLLSPVLAHSALANVSLPIPFTAQAPLGQWSTQPWADACEESVTIMVNHFYNGNNSSKLSTSVAMSDMNKIVTIENRLFGFNKDTNAEQMAEVINQYLPYRATVIPYPSLKDIKGELDAGRPVIALTTGKALKNPHFRGSGPDYHTLVIKGYDDATESFITLEPGTTRGLDYRYSYDTLMNALHDFVPGGKTAEGVPVVLFTDLPALENGTLVKLWNDPGVYYLEGRVRYPIISERAFIDRGFKWTQIRLVNPDLLGQFTVGDYLR